MRLRTSYDTAIKHLYRKGLEDCIPLSLRKSIPRNTIHRWRNEKDDKYLGFELNKLAASELELLKTFAKSKNAKRIFMSYVRIGRFIQSLTNEKFMKKQFKKHRMDLIDVVERAKQNIPLRTVLKCFNISTTTYSIWIQELFAGCTKSAIDWCLVRQPQQLNADEITVMRDLMMNPDYEHWPISSIAHFAKRNNLLHVSMSTWYKYARILNLRRGKLKFPRAKRKVGIKASRPNEIWHADVTYFRTGLTQCYVYLVVDNFSRKIIAHMVSEKMSAANRLATIKEAYENEFGPLHEDIKLLVDGGTENNNNLVDSFVHLIPNLTKLRALQDILRHGGLAMYKLKRTIKF